MGIPMCQRCGMAESQFKLEKIIKKCRVTYSV